MPKRLKRRIKKFLIKFKGFFLFLFLIFLFWQIFLFLKPLFDFASKNGLGPKFLYSFLFTNKLPLKKEGERTNILLLGMAGGSHEASDLTDTMIFLSLNQKKKKALLISLPRDIWSPTLKDKINSAFHYGEEKKEGGGLVLAKLVVEEVLGQPVHYAFLTDFSSFVKAIDVLGGLDIFVERSFDDFKFPIEGKENDPCGGDPTFSCRYEKISFKRGWERMNGERALKYIRSRNAEGEEGSDFSRASRQQKLLLAFFDKIFSNKVIFNPIKIIRLISVFRKGVRTDINLSETIFLGKLALQLKKENIKRSVLEEKFFTVPPVWQYGKWVLSPPQEDFSLIHQQIEKELETL